MGLVFHYLLTNGSSPIKLSSEIVSNELELKFTLNYDHLRNLEESAEIFFAIDLIKDMIKLNPIDRVKDSLHHPLFWRNWQYYEGLKKLHRSCGFYQEDAVMRNEEVINEINQKSQYLTDGLRITEDSILNKIQLIYNGKFDFTTPADIIRGVVHFLNDPVERSKLNPQIAKKIVRKKEDHNEVEDIIVNYVINEIKSQHPFFILHLLKLREDSHSSCKIKTDDLTFKHFPNDILGHGGNGSVVYKGKFQERPIAIKKVFKSNSDIVDREVYSLLKADSHPNTVRYFGTQEQENFYYIGIELCNCNLKEFIKDNKYPCLKKDMASKDIFRHITLGLKHLHKLNISKNTIL